MLLHNHAIKSEVRYLIPTQPGHLGLAVILVIKHFSEQLVISRTMVLILTGISRKLVVKARNANKDEITRRAERGAGGIAWSGSSANKVIVTLTPLNEEERYTFRKVADWPEGKLLNEQACKDHTRMENSDRE